MILLGLANLGNFATAVALMLGIEVVLSHTLKMFLSLRFYKDVKSLQTTKFVVFGV
jgi:hypothetical protein